MIIMIRLVVFRGLLTGLSIVIFVTRDIIPKILRIIRVKGGFAVRAIVSHALIIGLEHNPPYGVHYVIFYFLAIHVLPRIKRKTSVINIVNVLAVRANMPLRSVTDAAMPSVLLARKWFRLPLTSVISNRWMITLAKRKTPRRTLCKMPYLCTQT